MNVIHTGRLFIHYVLYILSILQLFVPPCYYTFWYISASFWRSLSLNPSLWPICAFGSCSINRHLHFSYRLTQYLQSEMKQESYVSVMCYFPANILTRHTQTNCVLCVGSHCVIARTDSRNGTQIGMCTFCIDLYILLYCWIDRNCWLSDTMTVFLVVLVHCAWHVSNCLVYH